jgi:hypothetical protein
MGKKVLYPIEKDAKKVFVYGTGWVKAPKKGLVRVDNLPIEFTAEDVKKAYDKYGWHVVFGLLQDIGRFSLFEDRSYYLEFIHPEILNMCRWGRVYDEFTDKVQAIGDRFVGKLKERGYREQGNGFYFNEQFLFFTDRETPIHPLRYVEHCHGFRFFQSKPHFNSIAFEKMLVEIIFNRYYEIGNKGKEMVRIDEIMEKYVSVRDSIAFLTDEGIADEIGGIFELQKVFSVEGGV